jgi:hypothetical protein
MPMLPHNKAALAAVRMAFDALIECSPEDGWNFPEYAAVMGVRARLHDPPAGA